MTARGGSKNDEILALRLTMIARISEIEALRERLEEAEALLEKQGKDCTGICLCSEIAAYFSKHKGQMTPTQPRRRHADMDAEYVLKCIASAELFERDTRIASLEAQITELKAEYLRLASAAEYLASRAYVGGVKRGLAEYAVMGCANKGRAALAKYQEPT